MHTQKRLIRSALASLVLSGFATVLANGCAEAPTVPDDDEPGNPRATGPHGVVEITISGLADGALPAASALSAASVADLEALRQAHQLVGNSQGPLFALTPPDNVGEDGDGTIQLDLISTGSFTDGERGTDGVRYLYATFRVRNAQSEGTPYDTPRQNLTFLAVATSGTIGETAVSQLRRFDGTEAASAIATELKPTGAVHRDPSGTVVTSGPDVLQVLTEGEAAAVTAPPGVTTVFPYGFVVRNPNDASSRTLPASPAAEQFDGVVTFAFKLPLQATAAEDPFTISIMVMAEDDSETRLTHSLEENGAAGSAAADARADALGASAVRVLPGASYTGDGTRAEPICVVRTAGTGGSPTAHLVAESVGSLNVIGFLVRPGAGNPPLLDVRDTEGQPLMLGARWTLAGLGIERVDAMGTATVRRLGPRPVSSTLAASACGAGSGDVVVWGTGYQSVAGGAVHSLALEADGTVVGWGYNSYGQTTPPDDLTDVVQVAVGGYTSLALKADGTVVGWGDDAYGQATPPDDLTDVVQVAAAAVHSLALKADGTVVGWGDDTFGQATPPDDLADVVQVTAGATHSLALKADGTVVGWGWDYYGQATPPDDLADVVQVTAGDYHSLALKADGTVVGWGDDSYGQATPPTALTDVVQVAAGYGHSLALKADGTVVGWGGDSYGQATPPDDLTDVVQVAAGWYHSLALKWYGAVVGWGWDFYGQVTPPTGLIALVP